MKKENCGITMKIFKIEKWLYNHKLKFFSKVIYRINYLLFNCSIPPTVIMGKNVMMPHGIGIIIHQNSTIGDNTIIYQHVTIGNGNGPKIGNNCIIGTGACVLGNITIGNNCKIGANAVVLNDAPDNSTIVGVPGKIVKKK